MLIQQTSKQIYFFQISDLEEEDEKEAEEESQSDI